MVERSRQPPLGSDNLNQNAWTFFFSNFPEGESESSMWKAFACQGVVVDLYIAKKRSRWGKRFGFVRFIKVVDWKRLEVDLNNIWIGKYRIRANLARFNRKRNKIRDGVVKEGPPSSTRVRSRPSTPEAIIKKKSFADVVRGTGYKSSGGVVMGGKHLEEVVVSPSPENLASLDRSLVGELKSFQSLISLGDLRILEGWPEVRFSYLGGLSVLLEFPSNDASSLFLSGASQVWKDWFSSLNRWSVAHLPAKRTALLDVYGIPVHVWNKDSLLKMGQIWGDVVNVEFEGASGLRKSVGQVYVLTEKKDWIIDSAVAIIEEARFHIRVIERSWDSWEMGEILSTDARSLNSKIIGDDSLWDDQEGYDNASNFSPESMEARQEPVPENELPATVDCAHREAEGSSFVIGKNYELMAEVATRKENDEVKFPRIKEQCVRMILGPCAGPFVVNSNWAPCKATTVEDGPTPCLGPTDKKLSPLKFKKPTPPSSVGVPMSDEQRTEVEDSESLPEGDDDFWITHLNFDGQDNRRRRKKKFKNLKSPCNCYRRKRGKACKHSGLEGNTVGDPYVEGRENQASSDSECLVRRSNKQILKSAPSSQQGTFDSLDSPISDLGKLVSIGKAIGLDLENKEGFLLNLVENGDGLSRC
ncbi:hypothetical protein OSB04_un001810 [Centaurea solstitialis]|uniref:RRM domain-containing protein n=1 Tax=Centaurea solstitialis TaxID=347529 RepID=A0AA38W2A7_9ASTR|nr:hypothetical protein OSB04_un001810 [Centaurea solstitialis]